MPLDQFCNICVRVICYKKYDPQDQSSNYHCRLPYPTRCTLGLISGLFKIVGILLLPEALHPTQNIQKKLLPMYFQSPRLSGGLPRLICILQLSASKPNIWEKAIIFEGLRKDMFWKPPSTPKFFCIQEKIVKKHEITIFGFFK